MELRNWKARVEAWFIRLRAWWTIRMELRSWRARVEAAREKYEQLEHLRTAIAPDFLKKVQETIEREASTTQSLKLPVLFFLLDRRKIESLQPLDQFLGYLRKHSNKRARREGDKLVGRLQRKATDYSNAAGAIFEIEILICLLEENPEDSFDPYPQTPNGRFPDASFRLGEKTVYLEATIRSQAEKQERALEIGHASSSIVVCTSDPYNDARLIIRKIEEKRKQLADKSPNILCLGLPDSDPNSLSVEWGVKPFFSGELKPAQSIIRRQESRLSNDKSLSNIEVEQIEKNIESLEQWEKRFQAEPRLTGVLVFRWRRSDFLPERYFWNPSPCLKSQLSPTEQKTILDWFGFDNSHVENEKSKKDETKGRIAHMSEQNRPLTKENAYMAGKILAFEDIQKFLLGLAEEKLSQRDLGYFARTLERMEKTALQSSSPAAFEEGFGEVFGPIQKLLLSKP